MRAQKIWMILATLALSISCKQPETSDGKYLPEIRIDVSKDHGNYDIAGDIESDFDLIALETNDSCLIGYIKKIIYANEQYYIQDDNRTSIFIFNKEGRFVSKLDRKGGGPDEYVRISTFHVKDGDIWIHDDISNKLICYDPDLNKRQDIQTDFPSSNMTIINNSIFFTTDWFWYGKESSQLIMYNIESRSRENFIPFSRIEKEDYISIINNKTLANLGDSCLFTYAYDNKLYLITENNVLPQYKYFFSERFEDIPLSKNELSEETDKIRGIDALFQTENSIILHYVDRGNFNMALYNKISQNCKTYSAILVNSGFGNFKIYSYFFTGNGEIIAMYEPENLINYGSEVYDKEQMKDHLKKQRFESIMSRVDVDDNPIIIKYKLSPTSRL